MPASLAQAARGATSSKPHYTQLQELVAAKSQPSGELASPVAMSGDTVVAGAQGTTVGGTTCCDDDGAVFVFQKSSTGWTEHHPVAVLTIPHETEFDSVGGAIAVEKNTIVIGFYGTGDVYVYQKPKSGWHSTSKPTATLTAMSGGQPAFIGDTVAISGDTIVTGAPGQTVGTNASQGAVFVFTKPKGGWHSETSQAELTGTSGTAGDNFGIAVDASGKHIVVGAWKHPSNGKTESGLVYVFTEPHAGWNGDLTQTRKLISSDLVAGDHLGESVAISGKTVVASAPGEDPNATRVVYVFTEPAGGWGPPTAAVLTQTAILAPSVATPGYFGLYLATTGGVIAASAYGQTVHGDVRRGAVDLYDEPHKGWATATESDRITASNGIANDSFGSGLAMSGSSIAVGADGVKVHGTDGAGAAYIFTSTPKPALRKVKQSHHSWKLGHGKPRINPKHHRNGGTRFSFRLDQSATVTLTFEKKTAHGYRHKIELSAHGRRGANAIDVEGPLGHGKKLGKGHYRVRIAAVNSFGEAASTKTLHFTTRH